MILGEFRKKMKNQPKKIMERGVIEEIEVIETANLNKIEEREEAIDNRDRKEEVDREVGKGIILN
jgi:hypothetical protein